MFLCWASKAVMMLCDAVFYRPWCQLPDALALQVLLILCMPLQGTCAINLDRVLSLVCTSCCWSCEQGTCVWESLACGFIVTRWACVISTCFC